MDDVSIVVPENMGRNFIPGNLFLPEKTNITSAMRKPFHRHTDGGICGQMKWKGW